MQKESTKLGIHGVRGAHLAVKELFWCIKIINLDRLLEGGSTRLPKPHEDFLRDLIYRANFFLSKSKAAKVAGRLSKLTYTGSMELGMEAMQRLIVIVLAEGDKPLKKKVIKLHRKLEKHFSETSTKLESEPVVRE